MSLNSAPSNNMSSDEDREVQADQSPNADPISEEVETPEVVDDVVEAAEETAGAAAETVDDAAQSLGDTVSDVVNPAADAVDDIAETVGDAVSDAADTAADVAADAAEAVSEGAAELAEKASDAADTVAGAAGAVGAAAGSAVGDVAETVAGAVSGGDEDEDDAATDVEPSAEQDASESEEEEDEEEEVAVDDSGASASGLRRGDIVEGTVTQTSPTEIMIALADDVEGIVSGRELSRMDHRALDDLEVGRPVLAYVLNPSNRTGQAVLSLTRALEENDWRKAQEYADSQELYNGKVSGYNKGGLIVRFGRVRGFVPASQVSEERRQQADGESPMERWGSMIGEDIVVKVVEVDRNRNRLILSERAAIKEWRDQRKADLLEQLEIGDLRDGRVVSLTDFGAFVDLGGADGLVHLTELSWKHVTRPDEIVKVGDVVKVKVISLDRDRRRIGLSMKALEEDPWEAVARDYQVGQLVRGTVTKLTKFGAFACLEDAPEIEGLIHISELSDHRVGHPREVVSEGETLTLRIVKIDRAQRRMGLSLKQVDAIDYLEIDLATYDSDQADAAAQDDEAAE
ncbi:MAG: S1 RNA-binding domain-containing protein [Anaerolineae bacterium]|nr:S1 RNA-binding domain-containing protein [Anaerolineae bacterium]